MVASLLPIIPSYNLISSSIPSSSTDYFFPISPSSLFNSTLSGETMSLPLSGMNTGRTSDDLHAPDITDPNYADVSSRLIVMFLIQCCSFTIKMLEAYVQKLKNFI